MSQHDEITCFECLRRKLREAENNVTELKLKLAFADAVVNKANENLKDKGLFSVYEQVEDDE